MTITRRELLYLKLAFKKSSKTAVKLDRITAKMTKPHSPCYWHITVGHYNPSTPEESATIK